VPSQGQPGSTSSAFVLKIPKPEPGEPEVSFNQWVQPTAGSPQPNVGNRRTESQPISPQPAAKNKGKQPISPTPEVASRDKRAAAQRASQALQIKEPKPEPGLVLSGKQKQSDTNALLKPKDEPFTEDMVAIEPLAIVPPGNFGLYFIVQFQKCHAMRKNRGIFWIPTKIQRKCLSKIS